MFYETNYLQHHGILGQKWGIRRYQNLDGSRTNLGKHVRDNLLNRGTTGTGDRTHDQVLLKKRIEKLTRGRSKGPVESANEISDKLRKKMETKSSDKTVHTMSDSELRDAINRKMLEKQYSDLVKDKSKIEAGKKALQTTGLLLSTATAAVKLYSTIDKMRVNK